MSGGILIAGVVINYLPDAKGNKDWLSEEVLGIQGYYD